MFTHTPGVGVVWDSGCGLRLPVSRCYYPLKTSRCCCQFRCGMLAFIKVFFQVAFVRFISLGSLFILVVIIRSLVSLSFIFLIHLLVISLLVWFFPCMTLSHLMTHTRWLASDIRICSSLVLPLISIDLVFSASWRASVSARLIQPMPIIVPKVICGQCWRPCGHSALAFLQISFRALDLHSSRICCMDSVLLQMVQVSRCSMFGMPLHFSPIMYA